MIKKDKPNKFLSILGNFKYIIIVFILIILLFVAMSVYYKNHFFPNTYINDKNVSGFTVGDTLRALNLSAAGTPSLKFVLQDGSIETIKCSDFDYTTSAEDEVTQLLQSQNSIQWISYTNFLGGKETNLYLDLEISYDKEKLVDCLTSLNCVINGIKEPSNATIVKTADGYSIQPEAIGDIIDIDQLKTVVFKGLKDGILTIDLLELNCYEKPQITEDNPNLITSLSNIKAIENVSITYDFKDRTETLDKNKISSWIKLDDNGNITLDNDAVSLYVSQLAYKYDTYLTDRQFTTTAGDIITIGGGIYGWQIDKAAETEELINAILSGQSGTREPIYYIKGFERATNDIGNTYIEVNLTQQHLWYYKDGTLFLESDIISGYPYNGHSTPTGVFCVWSREKDRQLVGETYDTHVDYWMPFDWTGCGLHDAWWQTAFGGEIYKTKYGSHGCLNLPTEVAKTIYENVKINTPVIIYE